MEQILDFYKDFISNKDYLMHLSEILSTKDMSKLDKDLAYEVIYADLYLTNLSNSITSDDEYFNEINGIKELFTRLVAQIPNDLTDSLVSTDKYKKLMRVKFYSKETDGLNAYGVISNGSMILSYLKSRLRYYFGMIILFLAYKVSMLGLYYITDISNIESTTALFNVSGSIIVLLFTLVFTVISVVTLIDVMYLSLPFVREMLKDNPNSIKRYFSKECLEIAEDGSIIKYRVIKDYNRIERNKKWLSEIISSLCDSESPELESIYTKAGILDKSMNSNGVDENSKNYFINSAKVELLYDEYLKLKEA